MIVWAIKHPHRTVVPIFVVQAAERERSPFSTRIASLRAEKENASLFDVLPKVTCSTLNYLTFVVAPCMIAGANFDLGRALYPSSAYPVALSVMRTLIALPRHK
jgi:hypothetical protein